MEAGYDYLLFRPRLQQRFFRAAGISLFITGTVLLAASIAYFAYAYKARSDLGSLNAVTTSSSAASGIVAPAVSNTDIAASSATALGSSAVVVPSLSVPTFAPGGEATLGELAQARTQRLAPAFQGEPIPRFSVVEGLPKTAPPPVASVEQPVSTVEQPVSLGMPPQLEISSSAIAAQQLYPGEAIKATYWSNPLEYEPASYVEEYLIQGFRPIDPFLTAPVGTLPAPTHIVIPSIGVDSDVEGLEVVDVGDSRAYVTPKNIVGHIPQEANPGERGGAWFFGHLESPLAGEGNVFYSLPKIPDLLRRGEDVYTIVDNGSVTYLYQITEAFVISADELRIDYAYLQQLKPEFALLDPEGSNIHLVVCVPRLVYDHRLVVSGKLVGIRE